MLSIYIPEAEYFNSVTNEFFTAKAITISLEHSLVSLSKWESKWKKPFLSNEPKSREQTIDYIRCMTITQNVPPETYSRIDNSMIAQIQEYIDDTMTATWFSEDKNNKKPNKEAITAELIYYWMIAYGIPFECQKWHLNRLLTLIRVCDAKNNPKKLSSKEAAKERSMLNAQRRAKLGSRG